MDPVIIESNGLAPAMSPKISYKM